MILSRGPYLKSGAQEIAKTYISRIHSIVTTSPTMISSPILGPRFENVFSMENREQTIINIHNKKTGFKFKEAAFMKKAAVLIPLCYDKQGQPAILYTLRSLNMNKHSGEISFPGGAMDPEDEGNDITTALRETEEELGISRKDIDIWTTLSPMPTLISLMGVTPVLGFVKLGNLDPEKLKISPNEVEKAFTVTLEHLCNPVNWREKVRMGFPFPVFKHLNIRHRKTAESDEPPDVPLWGLTAIITHIILEALVPDAYTRRIAAFEGKPLTSKPSSTGPSKL
jgi:nudix motif 8